LIAAGCDIGSLTVKAAVLKDNKMLGYEIIPAGAEAVKSATAVMDTLLGRLGLSYDDIDCCVSTGYGRRIIPFAQDNISEISCHGRGAHFLVPSIRTIIDIGGQDYKAIKVSESGRLETFLMNEKCAAGTGRTLELAAESIGIDVSDLGLLAKKSTSAIRLNFICSILIEIEVRQMVLEGEALEDIAAGINRLTARRVASLVRKLPPENDIVLTGGVAKNSDVLAGLEKQLNTTFVKLPEDPQIVGALGAALFAAERLKKNDNN
jgi:predicted CoA-substrate-specific enzyme activase